MAPYPMFQTARRRRDSASISLKSSRPAGRDGEAARQIGGAAGTPTMRARRDQSVLGRRLLITEYWFKEAFLSMKALACADGACSHSFSRVRFSALRYDDSPC